MVLRGDSPGMRSGPNLALMKAFAIELRARRNALEISQEELAHRCMVNRTYVAKLELAQNQPTLTVLQSLATGLEMDLPDLLALTLKRMKKEAAASRKSASL